MRQHKEKLSEARFNQNGIALSAIDLRMSGRILTASFAPG
jgi:hypothetical protein